MLCNISKLDDNALKSIQQLESEIVKTLVSFSCSDINVSDLGADVLAKVQKLEKELSVSLVALEA